MKITTSEAATHDAFPPRWEAIASSRDPLPAERCVQSAERSSPRSTAQPLIHKSKPGASSASYLFRAQAVYRLWDVRNSTLLYITPGLWWLLLLLTEGNIPSQRWMETRPSLEHAG